MTTALRCEGTLFGFASPDAKGVLEVKCKRRICGASPRVIVFHTLSLETGQVISTQRFSEPYPRKV